jgi:hypothetical protein
MEICVQCEEHSKKKLTGRPHENLVKIDALRIFKGKGSRGYKEQDYQCLTCNSKFTYSTNKNDLLWTLWMG